MAIQNLDSIGGESFTMPSGLKLGIASPSTGAVKGKFENDQSGVQISYYCNSENLVVAGYNLLGYSEMKTVGAGKYIKRKIPHSINLDGVAIQGFVFATSIEWESVALSSPPTNTNVTSFDNGIAIPRFDLAKLNVTYNTLPYDILSDDATTKTSAGLPDESKWERYITKVVKPQGEFFTVRAGTAAGNGYTYVGGGIVQQGIPKLIVPYNLMVTWHQIPDIAVPCNIVNPNISTKAAIDYAIGRVNDATFNNFAKGTLLLMGAELKPYRNPFGTRTYDITYLFKYFEPQDNKSSQYIFKSDNGGGVGPGWIEITTDGLSNLGPEGAGPPVVHDTRINKSVYDWFPGGGTNGINSDTSSTKGTAFADLFKPPA